jgi:hypothetical protein
MMTIPDKITELKFIIGRFDHYFDSINNKGNLYLTLNTFILGGSIGGFAYLNNSYHFDQWIIILFVIPTLFSNLVSFTYTLSAIRPFTRRHDDNSSFSSIFFVDVSHQTNRQWESRWNLLNQEDWKEDLRIQSQLLAIGLNEKFKSLSVATLFIGIQVGTIVLFGLYLFIH